jgi:hypothetical protein
VERLRARLPEITEAIIARVRDAVPDPARDEDPEYAVGLRAAVVAAIDFVLVGIAHGNGRQAPIPAAVVAQAQRAARERVSVGAVLRRYIAGSARLEDFVVQEANHSGGQGHGTLLGEALRTQAVLFDRLSASIEAEYMDESARAKRSREQHRAELVQELLAGRPIEAAELGYELNAWHLGLVATGASAAQLIKALAVRLDRELLSVMHSEGLVWAWLGGPDRPATADIDGALSSSRYPKASLAFGEPAEGPDGWRMTHQQALAALLVARRAPQRLTRYADVALPALALQVEVMARSLIDTYLVPLDSPPNGASVLRETLRVYLTVERSISSTAAALTVSRNTVEKRLRTIEKRLGRHLPTCLAELEVALRLEALGVTPSIH